jgi:hypothetical protein
MNSLVEARAAIADVKLGIAVARDLLVRGAEVDIAPLMPELDRLVNAIAGLPRETAIELKNELINLYSELDRFGEDLSEAHEALAKQLKGLSAGTRAASAYGRKPGAG